MRKEAGTAYYNKYKHVDTDNWDYYVLEFRGEHEAICMTVQAPHHVSIKAVATLGDPMKELLPGSLVQAAQAYHDTKNEGSDVQV